MKVIMKKNIRGYKGKDRGERAVYAYFPQNSVCVVKSCWTVEVNEQARKKGREMKQISKLWNQSREEFRREMSLYCKQYKKEKPALYKLDSNSFNHFVKLIFRLKKVYDLEIETIELMNLFDNGVRNVKSLVESGLLVKIDNWEEMTELIM